MIEIQFLADKIEEELKDACAYIDGAFEYMNEDRAAADDLAQLSAEELGHANKLHTRVVAVINDYRSKHGDPPPEMQWRYDYIHKQHIEKAREIKVKQALYKEESK